MRAPIAALALAAAVALPVAAASLDDLAGAERAALLRGSAEGLSEVQLRSPVPRLLPRHSVLESAVAAAMEELSPGVLVENLFLYRKPSGGSSAWTAEERLALFERMTALGTLAGIRYFSASRGEMRTFYETSSVIDNPRDRRPLPDPSFATLPATLTLYARQRDLTFGDNTYGFDFRTGDDFIFFEQRNLTVLNAGIVPAIGRDRFRMVMAVIDAGDSLLVYTAAMARVATLLGMGDRVGGSFGNRLEAVLGWFSDHADTVFR